MTILTVLGVIWLIGFFAFAVSVAIEAPKHGARIGMSHVIVGIIWPLWGAWYLALVVTDWWKKK